ncbi:hypothetical protein IAR55_003370 [Kwoniella newhampshirensis]|uniref:BAG domain-containing protein n=1 Tax=Kwoniella newhampshirensis TaxID=1651941 RepID=A0AAW0YNI0_9TREE
MSYPVSTVALQVLNADGKLTYRQSGDSSVQSLLALLRSTQDTPTSSTDSSATPTAAASTSYRHQPSIPSKRQLDDLLTSLNARPPPVPSRSSSGSNQKHLIEPFGPVGIAPGPSKSPYDPQIAGGSDVAPLSSAAQEGRRNGSVDGKRRLPKDRSGEEGYGQLGFGKALPVLTELLQDETFRSELRKMKKDQDALERRLWAKGEKVKAEHERGIQAERDIAKIARRPIPPEKKAKWAATLTTDLEAFYLQQCLPALDGLAVRQRQRLVDLGVPGLGEEDGAKGRDRRRRIIDILEAGLEE